MSQLSPLTFWGGDGDDDDGDGDDDGDDDNCDDDGGDDGDMFHWTPLRVSRL